MSQPIGMLMFRRKDGGLWGIEGSRITYIEAVPPREGSDIRSVIHHPAGSLESIDNTEVLCDLYGDLVEEARKSR